MARTKQTAWQPPNQGSAFKESSKGGLFLLFRPDSILALRAQPVRAWMKDRCIHRWRGTIYPPLSVGSLAREVVCDQQRALGIPKRARTYQEYLSPRPFSRRLRQNFARFLATAPAAAVRELREGYPYDDWSLFQLLVSSERAIDRCQNGERTLVYALSCSRHLVGGAGRRHLAFGKRWLNHPSVDIVERLGFPRRKLVARLLRRLPPSQADLLTLQRLRQLTHDHEMLKRLAHLPQLCSAHFDLLQSPHQARLSYAFWSTLVHQPRSVMRRVSARLLADLVSLEAQLDRRRRPRFDSPAQLIERHDELGAIARARRLAGKVRFPKFSLPLSGEDLAQMTPLEDSQALIQEGRAMRHCLGSMDAHHIQAAAGTFRAWALRAKGSNQLEHRGTLALIYREGHWSVYDAKGFANTPLPTSLLPLLRRILAAHGLGAEVALLFGDDAQYEAAFPEPAFLEEAEVDPW